MTPRPQFETAAAVAAIVALILAAFWKLTLTTLTTWHPRGAPPHSRHSIHHRVDVTADRDAPRLKMTFPR